MLAMQRALLATVVAMLNLSAHAGCPYPPQFPDPPPNLPPVVDPAGTDPYYAGGTLVVGTRPVLTVRVHEYNSEDKLYLKVVKDLSVSMDPESEIPHLVLLSDVVIGPDDVPPPEEGAPDSLRSKQVELPVTPCPSAEAGTAPVLTVCIADRSFVSYSDSNDPCLPGNRDSENAEERGYVARYSITYDCQAAP